MPLHASSIDHLAREISVLSMAIQDQTKTEQTCADELLDRIRKECNDHACITFNHLHETDARVTRLHDLIVQPGRTSLLSRVDELEKQTNELRVLFHRLLAIAFLDTPTHQQETSPNAPPKGPDSPDTSSIITQDLRPGGTA